MVEKLLSISEAAKLIGISIPTLRKWDKDGKFKPNHTNGKHRRYTMQQVQEYLDLHPQEQEDSKYVFDEDVEDKECKYLIEMWQKKSNYLDNAHTPNERRALAVLLENGRLLSEVSSDYNRVLSTEQLVWLTANGWYQSQFRNMISVRPMFGPTAEVYYSDGKGLKSTCVAAKSQTYNFTLFKNLDFDIAKKAYAECIGQEIDRIILEQLPVCDTEIIRSLIQKGEAYNLKGIYDYLVLPENLYVDWKKRGYRLTEPDVFSCPSMLNKADLSLLSFAGRYPKSPLEPPIFLPYILFPPTSISNKVFIRFAWAINEVVNEAKDKTISINAIDFHLQENTINVSEIRKLGKLAEDVVVLRIDRITNLKEPVYDEMISIRDGDRFYSEEKEVTIGIVPDVDINVAMAANESILMK